MNARRFCVLMVAGLVVACAAVLWHEPDDDGAAASLAAPAAAPTPRVTRERVHASANSGAPASIHDAGPVEMEPARPDVIRAELRRLLSAILARGDGARTLVAQLTATLGDPRVRTVAMEMLIELDERDSPKEVAVLLAAWGAVPDVAAVLELSEVYDDLRAGTRNQTLFSLAQDRGAATPDPSGVRASAHYFEVMEVAEPELLAWIADLVERESATPADWPTQLSMVVARSAHRDPELQRAVDELARRDDRAGVSTAIALMSHGRGESAARLSREVLVSDAQDPRMFQAAVDGLGRTGLQDNATITLIERVLVDGSATKRAEVIRNLGSVLAVAARCNEASAARIIPHVARTFEWDDEDPRVVGAAASCLSDIAIVSGTWRTTGLTLDRVALDERLPLDALRSLLRQQAQLLDRIEVFVAFERILDPESAPSAVRATAWDAIRARKGRLSATGRAHVEELAMRFASPASETDGESQSGRGLPLLR